VSRSLCRAGLALGGFLVAVLLVGCEAKVAEVSGKVTYKDKPLGSGVVMFIGSHDNATGSIDASGNYIVAKAPVGPCKVAVQTFAPSGGGTGPKGTATSSMTVEGAPPPPGPYVAIPEKYSDPNQSGLTFEVKGGKNTFPIKLE